MTTEEFIQSIALPGEEWRDVVGFENIYMVSSYGRIASVSTQIVDRLRVRKKKRKVLKMHAGLHNGIMYYTVAIGGKTRLVHRLVAQAFLKNPHNYTDVDHKDRNGLNNNVSNLRWCSHRQNQNNPNTVAATREALLGKRAPWNSKKVVRLKISLDASYDCIRDAQKDGFLPSGICNCLKGKSKTHGGFVWMYKDAYETLVSMSKNSTTD